MGKGGATVIIYVAVAQIDEHALEHSTTKVLVNAFAEAWRDIADNAPENRKAVGVDVVKDTVCGVDVLENDQPNVNRERRRSHAPTAEGVGNTAL